MDRRDFMKIGGLGIGMGLVPTIAQGAVAAKVGSELEYTRWGNEYGHNRRLEKIPNVPVNAWRMHLNTSETPMDIQELLRIDANRDQRRLLSFGSKLEGEREFHVDELQVAAYCGDVAIDKVGLRGHATAILFWDVVVKEMGYQTVISREGPRRDELMACLLSNV